MSNFIGQTLGPYQIIEELGHGSMASVFLAHATSTGRQLAIKVLPREFSNDPAYVKRFEREVKIMARLPHPRIVPIFDYGEYNGLPYFVMAYMPGGTLADLIMRAPNGLPLDETARLVTQVAEGLDYAHRQGVIHRDFKPSKALLDAKGNIYLAGFGSATVTADTARLTGSGIIGTLQYMAPEMSDPDGLSPLLDIYALGVTIYQMLTGRLPYEAPTPMGILLAHVSRPIPNARKWRADLPDAAQAVIEKGIAKDPADRFQNASEAAKALAAAKRRFT